MEPRITYTEPGNSKEPKGTSTEPKGTSTEPKGTSAKPKGTSAKPKNTSSEPKDASTKTKELSKEKKRNKQPSNVELALPTLQSLRPGFTRFGFRMNCTPNPFSVSKTKTDYEKASLPTQIKNTNCLTTKKEKPNNLTTHKENPNGLLTKSTSLNSATINRIAVAKETVMREKAFPSLSHKRDAQRHANRTIIKGVRTNRRFDLQMKMRNID